MKKRILTLLLALTLVAALFCVPVSAAQGSGATAMSADAYQYLVNYLINNGELYNTVYAVMYTIDVSEGLSMGASICYDSETKDLFAQAWEDDGALFATMELNPEGQPSYLEYLQYEEGSNLYEIGEAYIGSDFSPNSTVWFSSYSGPDGERDKLVSYNNACVIAMISALDDALSQNNMGCEHLGFTTFARAIDEGNQTPFVDVLTKNYFYDPVVWAVNKGVTNGTSTTTFSPEMTCQRSHVVTFLWRAAGSPAPKSTHNPFVDVDVNMWYGEAVLWAVEKGITNGVDATHFAPSQGCTRGQVVTFLQRYLNGKVSGASNPFTDVSSGAYYYDAVLWAVNKGITNGTSPTTFSPEATCTRGQIVTFLYRAVA